MRKQKGKSREERRREDEKEEMGEGTRGRRNMAATVVLH